MIAIRKLIILLFLTFIFNVTFVTYSASAFQSIVLIETQKTFSLKNHIEILKDEKSNLTIQDVFSKKYQSKFTPYIKKKSPLNLNKSTYWIRFRLTNLELRERKLILELANYALEKVSLFYLENNEIKKSKIDYKKTHNDQQITVNGFVFPISLTKSSTKDFVLRLQGGLSYSLFIHVWTFGAYIEEVSQRQVWYGLFYGILILIALYNLLIYGWIQEQRSVYYALWLLSLITVFLSGEGQLSKFSGQNLSVPEKYLFGLSLFLVSFLSFLLTDKLFGIFKVFPNLRFPTKIFQYISIAGILIFPFLNVSLGIRIAEVWVAITLIIVLFEILFCCFQQYWYPLLYFLAFSPLLFGGIARALMLIGVIEQKFLGGWGSLMGALFQAILMSLFLANHINRLKKQKEASDEESLKNIQRNHQIEQEFIIQLQEDSKNLEAEVESRAKELRGKNHQMKEELQMAVEIQQFMLPDKLEMSFLKSGLLYQPHSKVSGDIYRFSKTREDQFRFFLGDATGHGVSAAFITMMVQMALSSLRTNRTSTEVIQKLNKLLAMCIPDDKFMTGVFLEVSSKGWLQSCSAGHPPIMIFPKGKKPVIVDEQSHGMPLGMFGEEIVPYTEWTFQLSDGDLFIVYTDGVTEYENQQKEQFGEERLIQFIEDNRELPLEILTQELNQTLKDFSGCESNDDITLIIFEFQQNEKL